MNYVKNLNFFNGFLYGFIGMWLLPRKAFDRVAMFYFDLVE